jgi:type II secretory pathway pseudopilin PulG
MSRRLARRRGLTLLEILIAVALGIVLLGSVTTFAWSQLATRRQIMAAADARRTVTLFIDRLEQDLITAVAGTADGTAGVSGDSTAITVLARGVAPQWTDDPVTMIGDLHRLEASFNTSTGQLQLARSPMVNGDGPSLMPGHFRDLSLRYFDGQSWRSSWDSVTEGRLPVAVEIAVWYGRPMTGDEDEAFAELFDQPASLDDLEASFDEANEPFEITPDRRRVILIPDAGGDAIGTAEIRHDGAAP